MPGATRTIERLMVANRGEIASRVFRTARAMGISTAAVYAAADGDAPFVRHADVAVCLEGALGAQAYLDVEQLLAAAARLRADAVHPGYGFLAESAAFARAVMQAGLVWVGPPPEAIEAMALKVEAKQLMAGAGVPTARSAAVVGDDPDDWQRAAGAVGYPLLVKASAGGGGRGMRLVAAPADLAAAVASARREAASAFGDPTVFVERYLGGARHVEVQVVGDTHGQVIHLYERDCSVQRRHQKVVEEAPAPGLSDAVRSRLCSAAVTAARSIGYTSAGTVEFLLTGSGDDAELAFLEMNTRLQVEHPVTEAVTGLDLVRLQILVAQGEPLPLSQDDVRCDGHAVEARLYAEDPARGFLPSSGRLHRFALDARDEGVRVDSGVGDGTVVGTHFDPMLAKVVAHAPTRAEAVARLAHALDGARVHGLATNRDSLVATLRHPQFRSGGVGTDFLDGRDDVLAPRPDEATALRLAAVAALAGQHARRAAATVLGFAPSGWRNVLALPQQTAYDVDGRRIDVRYRIDGRRAVVEVDGVGLDLLVNGVEGCGSDLVVDVTVDGLRRTAHVVDHGDGTWWVDEPGAHARLQELPRFPARDDEGDARGSTVPVPGTVTVVDVAVGQPVSEGQTLVVLEAMKMEHRITAHADGVVSAVLVSVGDAVEAHQVVVTLDPLAADES